MTPYKLWVACLAAAAASAMPALAADKVTFKYNTAELRDEATVEKLHNRLMQKAVRACDAGNTKFQAERKQCARDLADQWVAGIDDQRLSSAHRRQS